VAVQSDAADSAPALPVVVSGISCSGRRGAIFARHNAV